MSQNLGFAVSGGPNASEIVRLSQIAEDLGYTSAWVAEGHGGDQFAVLGAVATATSSMQLGTAITSDKADTILVYIGLCSLCDRRDRR